MTFREVFFILSVISSIAIAQVGDNCELNNSDKKGICKRISDCLEASEGARNGISPTLCGFDEFSDAIVCCETKTRNIAQLLPNINDDHSDFYYPDEVPQRNSNNQRKSEQKCKEYSTYTEDVVQAIALTPNSEPINISVVKCNFDGVPLIVGGEPAAAGEFPYMAVIGFPSGNRWRCGGTLISEQFVLTAAHCTTSRDAGAPNTVRLGDLDLLKTDDGTVHADYPIRDIIPHPEYRIPQKYNDIALLKLQYKVEFTKYIRPACLYTKSNIKHTKAIATGYGQEDFLSSDISYKLLKVTLNFFENSLCNQTYKVNKDLPRGVQSTMICAGDLRGGHDTCLGDSGGPLLITDEDNNCKFFIVGITSFGKFCGDAGTPAIYTKVSDYVSWIENIVW